MFDLKILSDINPIVWYAYKMLKKDCLPPGTTKKRITATYEIDLVNWSEGGHEFIDDIRYDLKNGDLIFRKPGMVVESVSLYTYYRIIFSLVYPRNGLILDPIINSKGQEIYLDEAYKNEQAIEIQEGNAKFPIDFPTMMEPLQLNEFKTLFENIYIERYIDRELSHFFIKTNLLQVFALMCYELTIKKMEKHPVHSISANYEKILIVKKYINDNIQLKFSMDKLAAIAGLSRSYFFKTFKEVVGQTPVDYINKSKINEIKDILIYSDKEIKEICSDYCFEDQSYFFKIFKKFQGTTPSAYRKMYRTATFMDHLL